MPFLRQCCSGRAGRLLVQPAAPAPVPQQADEEAGPVLSAVNPRSNTTNPCETQFGRLAQTLHYDAYASTVLPQIE
jgi:hypothetical protein